MEPKIEKLEEISLVGKKLSMSFIHNKTGELWQGFMRKRLEIKHVAGTELFSVEVYSDIDFFKRFDPARTFEKWAAVRVSEIDAVPEEMDVLIVPAGAYAVFTYKGKPSEAKETYQYIYGQWLPGSEYHLDNRPHFAAMGEKHKGEAADSEEELWIPVRKKGCSI